MALETSSAKEAILKQWSLAIGEAWAGYVDDAIAGRIPLTPRERFVFYVRERLKAWLSDFVEEEMEEDDGVWSGDERLLGEFLVWCQNKLWEASKRERWHL